MFQLCIQCKIKIFKEDKLVSFDFFVLRKKQFFIQFVL